MNSDILVIGSLNMDQVVTVERHPKVGETVLATSYTTYPGGKGANQAIAAARLGAPVRMAGCLGNDAYGKLLLQNLIDNGVDTTRVQVLDDVSSGTAMIIVDDRGWNSIVVSAGANWRMTPEVIDTLEDDIARSGLVLLQLEIPQESVARAIALAKKHGVKVILNPAPAMALMDEVLDAVDYLIPNEFELAYFSGWGTSPSLRAIHSGARQVLERGVKQLIVTRGSNGLICFDNTGSFKYKAFHVQAVDTTAAGDAFIGGFAAATLRGADFREALRTGSAAGALTVTRAGAQTSLPTLQELKEFLKNNPS
jgi:ribokinase